MGSAIKTKKNILINHSDYNYISKDVKKINNTLEDLFHSKCDRSNCMDEQVFYSLFKSPNIDGLKTKFQQLFFHQQKKTKQYKITFTQFCYFYFLFVKGEEIYETKTKFLAELFFNDQENIDPRDFIDNMLKYCTNPNDIKFFFLTDFQKYIFKSKKQLFSKQKFIEYLISKKQILKPFSDTLMRTETELFTSQIVLKKMEIYNKYNSKTEFTNLEKYRPSLKSEYSSYVPDNILNVMNITEEEIQKNDGNVNNDMFVSNLLEKETGLFEDLMESNEQLSNMLYRFFNLFRVKKIIYMSEQKTYFQEQYTYVCDCLKSDDFIGFNRASERTASEEHIAQMRQPFKEYEQTKVNSKVYIQDLKELFHQFNVCEKLTNIICEYLERENQSTIIEFETFERLFKLFRAALYEGNKKHLLFYFLTYKKTKLLKLTKIKDLVDAESFINIEKEFNSQVNLSEFTQINSEYFIDDLFSSFEKINIIPFLRFGVIPTERAQFRECINSFGIDFNKYEEHLLKWCNQYDEFNAIPTLFLKQLNNYIDLSLNKVEKPALDIQYIGKIRDNNKISLKYRMKNMIDFYIIPPYIFSYFNKWFGFQKYCQEIKLNKIKIGGDELLNDVMLNQIGYVYQKDKQTYLLQYSKIFCKVVTFNELILNIKESREQNENQYNNINLADIYDEINEMMLRFRKPKQFKPKNEGFVYESERKDVIIELDWICNVKKIRKMVMNAKEEDIKNEISHIQNVGNIKSSLDDYEFVKKSIKLYYYVCDEIREIDDLIKGKMITDNLLPFSELLILVDYKNPGLINKTYTYDLIKEDNLLERNYSLNSHTLSQVSESMIRSRLDSQKMSLDSSSVLDLSIINPIKIGEFYTIITLSNIGNSCYINVIIQMILNSIIFKEIFFNKQNCIEELIQKINKDDNTITKMLLSMLNVKWNNKKVRSSISRELLEEFRNKCLNVNKNVVPVDKEGDANEFLLLLLNKISSELMLNVHSNFIQNNLLQTQCVYNDEIQCQRFGNMYWSNYIKNEASYILPIFSIQTKTMFTCNQCNHSKFNYDISKCLFLSVEPKKKINLNICLRRLPFSYKVYYESINNDFRKFKAKYFPKKSIIYNLIAYYQQYIIKNNNDISIDDYLPVEFTITIDKTKTIDYLISVITDIVELELEKNGNEFMNERNNEVEMSKETKLTSLLVWGWNLAPQFYYPEMFIQDCFEDEARVFIDEMLNVNGLRKVKECYYDSENPENVNISYSYYTSKNVINEIDNEIKKKGKQIIEHKNDYNNKDNIILLDDNIEQNAQNDLNDSNYEDNVNKNLNIDQYIKHNEQNEEIIDTSSTFTNKINMFEKQFQLRNNQLHNNNDNDGNDNDVEIKQENVFDPQKENLPLYNYLISNNIKDSYSTLKQNTIDNRFTPQIISINSLYVRDPSQFNKDIETFTRYNMKYEYIIEIIHCYQYRLNQYFFEPFQKSKIQFKPSFIVLPSLTNESLTPIMLYDLIWEKYRKYLQALTEIKKEELWWVRSNKYQEKNSSYRFCYPFCIKIIKTIDKNQPCTTCAFCYWYQFCSGCVLNPFNVEPINLNPNVVIEVEWCSEIVDKCYRKSDVTCGLKCIFSQTQEEKHLRSVQNKSNNNNDLLSQKKEEQDVDETLDNLFQFYLKSEINEGLKCDNCNFKGDISQQLSFYRLPELLVVNFQRFLYGIEGKKINSFIEYPLTDLTLTETSTHKEITYDLYCIINHLGLYDTGHYNCVIKTEENKWIKFDDLISEEITSTEELITQNAYILIYERRDSNLSQNSVFKLIEHLTQNLNNENKNTNKYFFEYEPVINDNKLFYFVEQKDETKCLIGDENEIYETNLNDIQKCLFIKDEQDENDKKVRKDTYLTKQKKNEGPMLERTMSMFKENIREKEIIGGKKSDACIII